MRAAILINHYTAACTFNDYLISLGYETYLSPICSFEDKTLKEEAYEIRNLKEKYPFIEELDLFDFYRDDEPEEKVSKIFNILENNFDLVITYFIINKNLNLMLVTSNLNVLFTIWGDFNQNIFTVWNTYIPNFINLVFENSKKYFLICHQYLIKDQANDSNKLLYLPLGLNNQIEKYKNFYSINKSSNKVLIILSRSERIFSFLPLIKNIIIHLLSNFESVDFEIVGKENLNVNSLSNYKNVTFKEFENTETLYENLYNYKVSINLNLNPNILQFSPLELACINVPFFYQENSAISSLILNNKSNFFCYQNEYDLSNKLRLFIEDPEKYLTQSDKNNFEIYEQKSFKTCLKQWEFTLNNLK